jgi:hypothetical protein
VTNANKVKINATLTLLLSLTACTSPDNKAFLLASKNFTYVSDGDTDSWQRFDSVSSKFSDDCEDFAFTLQAQIGGTVWLVKLYDEEYPWHAVLVKNDKAYDSYYKRIIPVKWYRAEFISVMKKD